uniref:HDC12360 n=1 Tax=Drosophila melanogaster TaxID=7227 RepID=Q6IKI5_DROME|nr:TPA_inf: HDC12360 [Drosophila melanogaster]
MPSIVTFILFLWSGLCWLCDVFDDIDLSDLCYFECGIKNVNHSFQIYVNFRFLFIHECATFDAGN